MLFNAQRESMRRILSKPPVLIIASAVGNCIPLWRVHQHRAAAWIRFTAQIMHGRESLSAPEVPPTEVVSTLPWTAPVGLFIACHDEMKAYPTQAMWAAEYGNLDQAVTPVLNQTAILAAADVCALRLGQPQGKRIVSLT
jgi:hypothetical protein